MNCALMFAALQRCVRYSLEDVAGKRHPGKGVRYSLEDVAAAPGLKGLMYFIHVKKHVGELTS